MASQIDTLLNSKRGPSTLDSAEIAQAVLEVTDTLVLVLDRSARIQYFNPACEILTGYSGPEVKGERIFDLLIPEEERADVKAYWRRLLDGNASSQYRNHWTGNDGTVRYITWSNAVVKAEDGTRYVVATGLDITEREKLERDIVRVSETERQRIGRELHDTLSTDLVAAAMKVDGLRNRVETGAVDETEVLRRLEEIEQAIRKGGKRARSISHLLAAGKLPPEKLPAALSKLVRTHRQFSESECTLEVQDETATRSLRQAETAGHLYRIAQEAVRNAVTHADADHVVVSLDTLFNPRGQRKSGNVGSVGGSDECVVLRVEDDGVGISEDATDELGRNEDAGSDDVEGEGERTDDGIGLQLMTYRADLIGADLSIQSEKHGGTVVQCVLPVS